MEEFHSHPMDNNPCLDHRTLMMNIVLRSHSMYNNPRLDHCSPTMNVVPHRIRIHLQPPKTNETHLHLINFLNGLKITFYKLVSCDLNKCGIVLNDQV